VDTAGALLPSAFTFFPEWREIVIIPAISLTCVRGFE
jgi:hypothetical protein